MNGIFKAARIGGQVQTVSEISVININNFYGIRLVVDDNYLEGSYIPYIARKGKLVTIEVGFEFEDTYKYIGLFSEKKSLLDENSGTGKVTLQFEASELFYYIYIDVHGG